jgi:hypothetical protein
MTDRAKFEQMLEYLINEDKSKAEELFHELVVAKSRDIYENLLDDDMQVDEESEKDDEEDDEVEEGFDMGMDEIGGDPADDMMGDLEAGDDEGGEDDMMGGDEGGGEPATKDDVMDIKDALDDLKAEFEAMLGGESMGDVDGDGDHDMDDHDAEGDDDMDDMDDEEEKKEEYVREYVEKVAPAKMGDNGTNTRSIVAKPNNMGGTTANLRGGESTKGGTAGGLANPSSKEDNAGNVNVPGAKKAATLSNVKSPKGGDNGVNNKSTIGA